MTTMEPIFFIHLTDIHISAPGKKPLFGLEMSEKLRAACAEIRTLEAKPSFVVISGDLTHDGDLEDYRFLKKLLDAEEALLGIPIHVALGNHDFREPFREGYLEEEPSNESYYYSFMADGLRIVMLNTQVPGTHNGRIDEVQLAWLKHLLAEPAPAARIDRANRWQIVWHVLLPLLSPTIMFMAMLSTLFAAEWSFSYVNVLTQGGPLNSTTNIYYLLWTYGFKTFSVGWSSAAAVCVFIGSGLISLVFMKLSKKLSFYDN
ncbi:hypothetical protein ASG89_34745 [Paenibacillus sp. Soil766]|uniref:metallophosphoesterase n=1 Tax=Paenibacillus sp. Soil766 TaxID=1736404 RepID=UPI0007100DC1|nr:metallophosphoesterase [Paenibacillus sp. Soil766]KRE89804.1 hypothetical protein ASG89_34745 [Paenibacillus sp. Soil766]